MDDNLTPSPDRLPDALLIVLAVSIRRRKLILQVALGVALLSIVAAVLLPRRYMARAVILPPRQTGSFGETMMAQLGGLGTLASLGGSSLGLKNPNDLQVSLLRSQTVEDAMIRQFHLEHLYHCDYLSETRKQWEKASSVDDGDKDGLIRLSVSDRDAARAAAMANAWVQQYIHFTENLAVTEASQRRLFFQHQLESARADLALAEENLKQTQQRTGVIEIDTQARAMIAAAAMLRAQVVAKQVEIRGIRQFAADQNPDFIRAEQELAGLQAQLASLDAASDRRDGDLSAPGGRITEDGLEYTRALREVKYRQTIVDLLSRQFEVARIEEARQGSVAQIVDPALVPDRPNLTLKFFLGFGAPFFGLFFGLLAGLTAEGLSIARSRGIPQLAAALESTR
jgi:uncharacterized protein involved in exopolysaccharide biosynthesis